MRAEILLNQQWYLVDAESVSSDFYQCVVLYSKPAVAANLVSVNLVVPSTRYRPLKQQLASASPPVPQESSKPHSRKKSSFGAAMDVLWGESSESSDKLHKAGSPGIQDLFSDPKA